MADSQRTQSDQNCPSKLADIDFSPNLDDGIFRILCENSHFGIFILEEDIIRYVNPAMAKILGYTPEELIGDTPFVFIHPDAQERVRESIRKRLSGELLSDHYEIQGLGKNGESLLLEVMGSRTEINAKPAIIGSLIDISKRRQNEVALNREKSLLSSLVRTIPDPVWLKDPTGIYLSCNPRFEELYGAVEAEIVGKRDTDFVSSELAAFFRKNDLAAIDARQPISNEEWLTFAKDSYRGLFETFKTPMYDADKNLIGVLGIARDITHQRETENKLKQVNQTYAVLIATNQAVIRIRERQALFQEICQIAVEKGCFSMAWIGKKNAEGSDVLPICQAGNSNGYVESLSNHYDPTSQAMIKSQYFISNDIATDPIMQPWREAALARGFRSSAYFPIFIYGEVLVSLNLYAATPDFFDHQEIELLQQLSADLGYALESLDSEAKYLQKLETLVAERTKELKLSERRFRSLIEGVQSEYFFFSVGENHEFTYLSPSAEAFLGLPSEEMLGKPWYQVLKLGPKAQQLNEQLVASMSLGQEPPPFEIEYCLNDQLRYFEINEHILRDEQGVILGGEGVVKDITRQKQIELELREAKQKAEKSSQAKSQFLSHMSHEIRTPLNSILGFSELMQEQIKEPRWQNFIQAINSSGKTLLHIINDILDLSKIEAGKVELQPQPINLSNLIQELELLLRYAFEQKGLNFLIQISPELPPNLWIDPLRIRQILMNLLSNALKYTQKGQVTLELDFLYETPNMGQLSLKVRDTGSGISSEFQKRIFSAFEQESGTKQLSTGTGLGLAITHSLVELMQGQILLESQVGKGSCFSICLPRVSISENLTVSAAPNELSQPDFVPARLLLADDVPENLNLLQAYLENTSFEFLLAHNGQEACKLAELKQPDLILMDIRMPVMDGTEALHHLKANPATADIPIIALTAYSLQQEENDFLEQGFDGYLRKPIKKSELWNCLKVFIAQIPPIEKPEQAKQDVNLAEETDFLPSETKTEWLARWKKVKNSVIIDELENFAQDFYNLGKQFALPTFQRYAESLLKQTQQFALETVSLQLQSFPSLLESIQANKKLESVELF
jgi:PAS domain S-box-containing protein